MLARELSRYRLSVVLLEKENDVACGASKANSGIIHGGYDPEPGTLKAKLNSDGVTMLYETARQLNVPYKNNGSMVAAFCEEEEKILWKLFQRGIDNGIYGLKVISGDEARRLEPMLSTEITAVLLVPTAGIICPYELTIAAVGNAMDNGVTLLRNFETKAITQTESECEITSALGDVICGRYVVNCARVYADKIAAMIGDSSFKIIPRAGEYMFLDKTEGCRVLHTIFQVPTENGKGILVTPTVDGNLLTGPTAAVVNAPDDTDTTSVGIKTVGTLAEKSVPSINFRQVITSFSGVRASEENGDFIIRPSVVNKRFIHAAAIDSPGLTSCVAVAEYVVNLLKNSGLELNKNSDFNGYRDDPHAFRKMNDEQKDEYIKHHPDYGKIICRCETVSEGEIRDAIKRNPKPADIDGVKRRTRSGMGRCQGGFCSPFVMKLLAEENGSKIEEITKKGNNSKMVIGKL